jgi:hypothetical protein
VLLGVDPKTVWVHWQHFQKHGLADAPTGRPTILTKFQTDGIVDHAMAQFLSREPVTLSRLAAFTHSEYGIEIGPDILRHALQRDGRLKTCEGRPMETQRVQVSLDSLLDDFATRKRRAENVPTAFVWNMDEIGHSDWVDACPELVYVPAEVDADSVPIPVNRGRKGISLELGCVCADGIFLKLT